MSGKGFRRLQRGSDSDDDTEETDGFLPTRFTGSGRHRGLKGTCCCLSCCLFLLVVLLTIILAVVVLVLAFTTDILTNNKDDIISLKVNTTVLEKSGDWVTVSWENVEDPSTSDWIGVYSTVDGDIDPKNNYNNPYKFQYAQYSAGHMEDGSGSLELRLINMREDFVIAFFRTGLDTSHETAKFTDPTSVAVTEPVRFRNRNEPTQGHLALTGDPTQMTLMWVSFNSSDPRVKLGTESGNYSIVLQADSSTYNASSMCGSPATDIGYMDPGLIHQVTMDNLVPGTQYYYIFGDVYGWSEEFSFRAAPKPGPDVITRVVAFGDMGVGHLDDTMQVIRLQQASLNTTGTIQTQLNQTDVLLHIGDISYARGYASVWDQFFDQIEPIATRIPYMVCIGNHERDWPNSGSFYGVEDSEGECGVPHERRLPMPRPSLDEAWYGFDYGSIHFVLMSTEHNFTEGSKQYQFLEQHLQTVNRSITPWLIFSGHRPMYVYYNNSTVPSGIQPVAQLMRDSLEPLLKNYSVDVALWGHEHSYQRTYPVYQEKQTEGATTHLVIGMAGQRLSDDSDFPEIRPDWLAKADHKHYGYLQLEANATTLTLDFVWNENGEVLDSKVLTKPE